MAFDVKKLAPVAAPFNGNTKVHTYASTDTVTAASYFNDAYTKLAVGDLLISSNPTSGAIALYKVTASASTGVTIAAI